jgi:hypothetical protein
MNAMMNAMKQRQCDSGHKVVHLAPKISPPAAPAKTKASRSGP